jgi:intracellular sulfur oxidation DsrE/DsrF family protein
MSSKTNTSRRQFLGALASCASAGIGSVHAQSSSTGDAERWLEHINGKHKMVFDSITANGGHQLVWASNFLESNNQSGVSDQEQTAVVVLRNKAVALALNDTVWKKFKLGKFYNIVDPTTNVPSDKNIFWESEDVMPERGMNIKTMMTRGVLFCVCDKALTLNARQIATSKGLKEVDVKNEWISALLPGIQLVPSGVWALNRVQEKGASYCYAG